MLTVKDTLIAFEASLDIESRFTYHEFKYMIREVGFYKFKAELVSMNYKGLDVSFPFEFVSKKESTNRVEFIKSIEKREPKKLEPSYFQQMINEVFPVEDEEEEEEEEEETETQKENTKGSADLLNEPNPEAKKNN